MPDRPPALVLVHSAAGRMRLRPDAPQEPGALTALADRLAALPGVRRVLARPATGSLIVTFDGAPEALVAAIAASGLGRPRSPAPPPPLAQVAQAGMLRADMAVRAGTADVLDLRTAAGLLLLVAAGIQVARGRFAGPATSLAATAFALLAGNGGRGGARS